MSTLMSKQTLLLLEKLKLALVELSLWQNQLPSEQALQSSEPFCIDTLSFEQWLQFVFIERLTQLIINQQALPNKLSVAPMAEHAFADLGESGKPLIKIIADIDALLSNNS